MQNLPNMKKINDYLCPMKKPFNDKVVWITGASSGIGAEIAKAFSKQGAKVVLSARKKAELEQVAKECAAETMVLPLDLTAADTFDEAVKKVVERFGRIDILVNNGGMSQRGTAVETELDVDRRIMEVNYFGNIALSKKVAPIMRSQCDGAIVVISSLSGKFGFFLRSAYAASKFALVGFYESMRLEEEKNNVRIHLVFPGFIHTDISFHAIDGSGKTHGKLDNNQKTGMPAEECARQLLVGIKKNKEDIYIGGKELFAITLQRFCPWWFKKVIRKQSAL
jgi:dehydrogenase/reductase SDR family member 7B